VTCTLLLGAHCVTCTLLLGLPILYFLVPRPPLWEWVLEDPYRKLSDGWATR
jgi:hypothetical protein